MMPYDPRDADPPDDAVSCDECDGTGWTETEYRRYCCVHCNGTGLVEYEGEPTDEQKWWEEVSQ